MKKQRNIVIDGQHGKPISLDVFWQNTNEAKPVVIFAHGFKGFKDWGTWWRIGEEMVKAGFVFVKMNFSHNGTTPENLSEFGDLEAFSQNNYSIELDDLSTVLDWLKTQKFVPKSRMNLDKISLIGHSRGGGVAIVKAFEDDRIKNLVTWSSVGTLDWMFKPEMVEAWKKSGVHIIVNGRTKQEMPLSYQLFEDFEQNQERFDIKKTLEQLNKPHLIVHGTNDTAIPVTSAELHKAWNPNAKLVLIDGADHVFGGKHPFQKADFSEETVELLNQTITFLKEN